MWEKGIVTCFKVTYLRMPIVTGENHENISNHVSRFISGTYPKEAGMYSFVRRLPVALSLR